MSRTVIAVIARARACVFTVFCLLALLSAAPASAQSGPEVSRGLLWLQGQVQADGTLASEGSSQAQPLQARSETLHTLQLLGTPATALLPLHESLAADTEMNTEFMARRALALAARGTSPAALIDHLQLNQNSADGGYGGAAGFASHALDTAFVLRAQRASPVFASDAVSQALNFLAQARNADGAYVVNGQPSLFVTSHALLAATAWNDQPGAGAIGLAGEWLLAQRNADLNYGNAADNALALSALVGHAASSEALQALAAALKAEQLADGSWNNDPYVTALALRALYLVDHPPTPATGGALHGIVTGSDGVTGLPNVTVQILGPTPQTVVTDARGRFTFPNAPAGTLTLRFSQVGQATRDVTVVLGAGQNINLGNIGLTPAPLTSTISGVIRSDSGTALAGALITSGSITTVSDAAGAYVLGGLSPGEMEVTVRYSGRASVSATFTVVMGTNYIFSPRLPPASTTPPKDATISGVIISGATQKPLAGASVQAGGVTVVTATNGAFSLTKLVPGPFTLTVAAAGYQGVALQGMSAAGINSVGNIALTLIPSTSTLTGTITDAASGAPIAGASVKVAGQGVPATTGADGKYSIAGLTGTTFTLTASATNYLQRNETIALSGVGSAVADLALQAQDGAGSDVSFIKVETINPTYPGSAVIPLEIVLSNNAATSAAVKVSALVLNDDDSVVHEYLANPIIGWQGLSYGNNPVTLAANSTIDIMLDWSAMRLPAGRYRIKARAMDLAGILVAQADSEFNVTAGPILVGGVAADPPLAQAGAQTQISLTSELTNTGNTTLEAGDLKLRIVLERADNTTDSQVKTIGRMVAGGAPMLSAKGLVEDAQGNFYTVNATDRKVVKIAAGGTQTVLATLPAGNVPSDVALDQDGNVLVSVQTPPKLFKVAPDGALGMLPVTSITGTLLSVAHAGEGALYLSGLNGAGEWRLVRRAADGSETVLWGNGLANPFAMVKDPQGNFVVTDSTDGSLVKVNAVTAVIIPFVGGLNKPKGIAMDASGNFFVANSGANTIVKVTPDGQASVFATGLNQPTDVRFDASGNLFVSNTGNDAIMKVLPNGTVELFAQGVANGPTNMRYDAAGALWLSNTDGTLRRKDAQDNVSVIATGLSTPRGIGFVGADVLVAEAGSGRVSRVQNGAVSPFATGLAAPTGIAVDGGGTVFVTEKDGNRIARFDSAGNKLGVTETRLFKPAVVRTGANGDIFIQNTGFVSLLKDGNLSVLQRNFNYTYWAPDTVNGGFVALNSRSVVRIAPGGAVTTIKASLPFTPQGIVLDEAGAIVLLDASNRKLHKLDAGGNVTLFSTLPSTLAAGEMQADAKGNVYVRLHTGVLHRVTADGQATPLTFGSTETIRGWAAGFHNELVVWSSTKTYRLDPLTNQTTVWLTSVGSGSGERSYNDIAVDAGGKLVAIHTLNHTVQVYGADGTDGASYFGFAAPVDIVWTGSEMRFVDGAQRLFSLTGDNYPVRKNGKMPSEYLAQRGSDTLGSASTSYVYRWTGAGANGYDTYSTPGGNLGGMAARADGAIAVGESSKSTVMVFDSAKALIKEYAGLRSPQGMAFDASGRLYVANNAGDTIARFDSLASSSALTFTRLTGPVALAVEASGQILVARANTVMRVSANGASQTQIGASTIFTGLVTDGATVYAMDYAKGQLRKMVTAANSAVTWDVFASGLSRPVAVRTALDGAALVLNQNNNTVVKYSAGKLTAVANVPAGMNALAVAKDGTLTVAGNNGWARRIGVNGAVTDLGINHFVNDWAVTGTHVDAGGKLYVITNSTSSPTVGSLHEITVSEPTPPPAAGSVVHETRVPMGAMEANGTYTHFDLGKWVPPYGGDFKIELSRDGVSGMATNFVHVGPHAKGQLSASSAVVPPGDSELNMCLDLRGADFSSISRVETALVRPVSTSGTPYGMASDRRGNLYVTTSNALLRTDETGTSVQIAGGMSLGKGLAVDNDENFYVTSMNSKSGTYDLVRISLAGVKTVVANLGVSTANGLQINSKGEVLIGSPGKLLKVDKQGAVSILTTAGVSGPLGLAIDGRDNVFVQNSNHLISMTSHDGKTSTVFSTDKAGDPVFEGDGFPTIAADCAENFYMAPYTWARVGQGGEEHSLVQVVPRTGNVALLFDTRHVDSTLTDIDYLEFDRFNSRLLMWNHGSDRIWQVPVSCGAIGVQAHLVAQPGQSLTGASTPPRATLARADGRTEYVWSLRDVTAEGAQVCFNAAQRGFKLGEERKAIDSGFISFQNTFASGDVTVPLTVPMVRAVNLVNLDVGTDSPSYPQEADVVVSTTLANTDTHAISGALSVQVIDSNGVLVGKVTEQSVTLAGGASMPVIAPFNTGAHFAGDYTVIAVLSAESGALAQARSTFRVLAGGAGSGAHATLATDRKVYAPNERVLLQSRVFNDAASLLDKLTLTLQVVNADGATQFEHSETVLQLAPGAPRDTSATQTLRMALPGVYTVKQTLRDAGGIVLSQATALYNVASSADTGAGLSGNVMVMPKTVKLGDSLGLTIAATNGGNSALPKLPLKLAIADSVEQKIVAEFFFTPDVNVGATYNAAANWISAGVVGRTYVAVLTAQVGGKTLSLGQDDFNLIASPIKLDIAQSLWNGNRVLALVSCKGGEPECDADGVPSACFTERAQTISQALTAAGVSFTIASNETDFKRELRSGRYNTYWISGKQDKLHDSLAAEVREAVFGGDGLIMDSEHDQRNKTLDQATGVRWSGKIGELNLPVDVFGAGFPRQKIGSVGRALKMGVTSGTVEANFAGGKPHSGGPAMIGNLYGAGHAMVYGFDLAASLRADARWQKNLEASLKRVLPATAAQFGPGAVVPLNTRITNLAQATGIAVQSVLPAGAVYLGSDPVARYDADPKTVNWLLPLGEAASADLKLTFQLGAEDEPSTVSTVVSTVKDGVSTPYGDPLSMTLERIGGEPEQARTVAMLGDLVLSSNRERQLRARLVAQLNGALQRLTVDTRDSHEAAIGELVGVIDGLAGLSSANTAPVRTALDRVLKDAQWRWSRLPPAP